MFTDQHHLEILGSCDAFLFHCWPNQSCGVSGLRPHRAAFTVFTFLQSDHFRYIIDLSLCIVQMVDPREGALITEPVPDQFFGQLFHWIAENQKLEVLSWRIHLKSAEVAASSFSVLENHSGLRRPQLFMVATINFSKPTH